MPKILHIKLTQIQFLRKQELYNGFFSFEFDDQHYFSSVFNNQTTTINDDIVIKIGDQVPQNLMLHRWQKHMILFTHYINISELKTRICSKKKHETKSKEVLSFTISLLDHQEIQFTDKYVKSISQHYIKIHNITIKNQMNRVFQGPSYFLIITQMGKYEIPVVNSSVILHVPIQMQFLYYRTGELLGKSDILQYERLNMNTVEITLQKQGYYKGQVTMNIEWGLNLKKTKIQTNLLIDAHEIMIYDIQVKFQNFNEFTNSKVKIGYGNKAFELVDNFTNNKITKFKKIIHFMIRSEEEEVQVIVDKNSRAIARCRFLTQEITPFIVNTINKKICEENTGRLIGNIKFKCQMGKTLSVPANNEMWREITRKKTATLKQIVVVQQISLKYPLNEECLLIFKVNETQFKFNSLTNFNFYEEISKQKNERALISIKPDQSIYMILKNHYANPAQNTLQGDFIGIAVLNTDSLRLGESVVEISFFKNQEMTSSANFKCNKIVPYMFIKPVFIPQQLFSSSVQTMNISLFLNKINLTPYYHTYEYDGKNQLYCIAQVNRIKKVLILQGVEHDQLTFVVAAGSDSLDFIIEQTQFIKIKFILMVSDVGHEEEIYANASLTMRIADIDNSPIVLQLLNSQKNQVGKIMVQIGKKNIMKIKPKQSIKLNSSVQIENQGRSKGIEVRASGPRRHSGKSSSGRYSDFSQQIVQKQSNVIKLPKINEKKKINLDKVLDLMRIRKRGVGGVYDSNNDKEINNIQEAPIKYEPYKPNTERELNLRNIQKNNPNLQKNFQMLFPKKNEKKIRMKQYQRADREFKGLKSVYEEISHDIGQVEPTVKDSRELEQQNQIRKYYEGQMEKININNAEWQGNQFAQPNQ